MRNSLFAVVAAAGLLFEVGAAGAATLSPLVASPSDIPAVTLVSGGCGPYYHRGPYGGCRPNFYRPYGYGYGYRPFYRPYGYGYGYRRFFF